MKKQVEFETPENIKVSYKAAGVGTRFLAWYLDSLLVSVLTVIAIVLIIAVILSVEGAAASLEQYFEENAKEWDAAKIEQGIMPGAFYIILAVLYLLDGVMSFSYFWASEYIGKGRTLGKRWLSLRVVKADGFALDASSIFVRNIYRLIDNFPLLWLVPVLSGNNQRLGDKVAGTYVIRDKVAKLNPMREKLLSVSLSDCKYRFRGSQLDRLRENDVVTLEKIILRIQGMPKGEQQKVVQDLVKVIAGRMGISPPTRADNIVFLEDLLAAEYHRQYGKLGLGDAL